MNRLGAATVGPTSNGSRRRLFLCRTVRYVGLAAIVFFVSVAFTPLPNLIARSLSVPTRLEPADAIVVLGGGVDKDGELSVASLRRTVHSVRLFRKGLAPIVVFSGGPIMGGVAEGAAMAAVAEELSMPSAAILTETESTNTATEAETLARLLHPRGVRKILFISGALHMARAQAALRRVGFEVLTAPTDSGLYQTGKPEARMRLIRQLIQELAGRTYYRLRGWI